MSNECLMYHCITISFCEDKEAMVYIEDAGADNDGQIGAGIDVMVPTNGPILSLGKTVLTWDLLTPRLANWFFDVFWLRNQKSIFCFGEQHGFEIKEII